MAEDSIRLFDDRTLDGWLPRGGGEHEWAVVGAVSLHPDDPKRLAVKPGEGIMYNGPTGRTADLYTEFLHGDCEFHCEFMMAKSSNSGVYFMGRYEVQVLDSWGAEQITYQTCGAIYARWINKQPVGGSPPKVNASRPPGEWQTYDVTFRAPRFDADGNKTENAKFIQIVWNGEVVQENVELEGHTRAAMLEHEAPTGPLLLQGDHGPVAYRNVVLTPASF